MRTATGKQLAGNFTDVHADPGPERVPPRGYPEPRVRRD